MLTTFVYILLDQFPPSLLHSNIAPFKKVIGLSLILTFIEFTANFENFPAAQKYYNTKTKSVSVQASVYNIFIYYKYLVHFLVLASGFVHNY